MVLSVNRQFWGQGQVGQGPQGPSQLGRGQQPLPPDPWAQQMGPGANQGQRPQGRRQGRSQGYAPDQLSLSQGPAPRIPGQQADRRWRPGAAEPGQRPDPAALQKELFSKLDKDGDGYLSPDEFKVRPEARQKATPPADFSEQEKAEFEALDAEREASRKQAEEEFKAKYPALAARMEARKGEAEARRSEELNQAFAGLDNDGDGKLSADEFKPRPPFAGGPHHGRRPRDGQSPASPAPLGKVPAPPPETAPAEQAPAPVVEDSAPKMPEPLPIDQDPELAAEDSALVSQDPAPTVEDSAPAVQDPASAAEDSALAAQEVAPVAEAVTPAAGGPQSSGVLGYFASLFSGIRDFFTRLFGV